MNPILKCMNKHRLILLVISLFFLYSFFIVIRPYEDDEANHITAGKAIIEGELQPFKVIYYGHFSNPFGYIMGSPLVPLIYGSTYLVGGITLTRVLSMLALVSSIFLVHKIIKNNNGNYILPLILIGLSSSSILLASDAYLDSFAVFFLISSIFFIEYKKMFLAGLLASLGMITKFVLVLPFVIFFMYLIWRKKWVHFLIGVLIIVLPFIVLYRDLLPIIINFIFLTKITGSTAVKAKYFFFYIS